MVATYWKYWNQNKTDEIIIYNNFFYIKHIWKNLKFCPYSTDLTVNWNLRYKNKKQLMPI